ncbi:hypothetical protein SFB4_140G2, partial [Candidatus Arthromitus sp. SFB-4]
TGIIAGGPVRSVLELVGVKILQLNLWVQIILKMLLMLHLMHYYL